MEKGQGKGTDTLQTDKVVTRKEYIEREAAIEEACHGCSFEFSDEPCEPCDCEIMARLKAVPAADVVPVVRCKFCRSQRWCKFAQYLGNDGFCSQGEYATNCGDDMRDNTQKMSVDEEVKHG